MDRNRSRAKRRALLVEWMHASTYREDCRMIKVGDTLPDTRLFEFIEEATEGCAVGPNGFSARERAAGKRVVIFGLPGAFTPTCSARHLPGYVDAAEDLFAIGIDEIWCVSVNDAFVMSAWGGRFQTKGKVKMIADGNALFSEALGLVQDLTGRGMGIRSQRYAMVVDDCLVTTLNVEAPGGFDVSDARSILATLG